MKRRHAQNNEKCEVDIRHASASRFSLRVVAIATLVQVLATPALVAEELVLEEVIVTARKRVESLQETPLAVTAVIESSGVGGYAVVAPRMYGAELQYRF